MAVRLVSTLGAVITLGLAACGGEPAAPDEPGSPSAPVSSVSVTPATVTLAAAGATRQLTAVARGSDGTVIPGHTFTWSSSNDGVASVSNSGLVAAVASGSATISATTGGASGSATVTVTISGALAQVSAGSDHSCALTGDGVAWCWGGNTFGQLGDGTTSRRLVPTAVQGGMRFRAISAGYGSTCAVAVSGEGYCWGWSDRGQVGDGGLQNRTVPSRVVGVSSFSVIESGRAHACGLASTGIVYCWGWGTNGEMGNGALVAQRVSPDSISGGRRYTAIGGTAHTICAIANGGETWCWGRNNTGQVGDGTATCGSLSASCLGERALPTRVQGTLSFTAVSAGARIFNGFGGGTACGIAANGDAYCWGQGTSGQLGDGATANRFTPTLVSGARSWRTLDVGSASVCGVTAAGAGFCWGFNGAGALGDGTTIHRLIPTAIAGSHAFTSVSAGFDHACAVTVDNDVYCWGANGNGQLGDGTMTARHTPVLSLAAPN